MIEERTLYFDKDHNLVFYPGPPKIITTFAKILGRNHGPSILDFKIKNNIEYKIHIHGAIRDSWEFVADGGTPDSWGNHSPIIVERIRGNTDLSTRFKALKWDGKKPFECAFTHFDASIGDEYKFSIFLINKVEDKTKAPPIKLNTLVIVDPVLKNNG